MVLRNPLGVPVSPQTLPGEGFTRISPKSENPAGGPRVGLPIALCGAAYCLLGNKKGSHDLPANPCPERSLVPLERLDDAVDNERQSEHLGQDPCARFQICYLRPIDLLLTELIMGHSGPPRAPQGPLRPSRVQGGHTGPKKNLEPTRLESKPMGPNFQST